MIDRDTVIMMKGNMYSQRRTSAESGTGEMPSSEIMDIEFDENVARVVPCLTTRDNIELRLNNEMKEYNRRKESGS
jgi:hypothetical protein